MINRVPNKVKAALLEAVKQTRDYRPDKVLAAITTPLTPEECAFTKEFLEWASFNTIAFGGLTIDTRIQEFLESKQQTGGSI